MNKEIETFNINWQSLGARLASLSTEEQIPFFVGFCNEMLKYPSHHDMEMQLTYIREGMSNNKEGFTEKQRDIFLTLGYTRGNE